MFHWLHHLFNPHCEQCSLQNEEDKVCKSCETLRMQLSIANLEKERLLKALLDSHKPIENTPRDITNFEPLQPKVIPWAVRKQMLEAEDRKAAQLLAKKSEEDKNSKVSQEIESLEKELGVG